MFRIPAYYILVVFAMFFITACKNNRYLMTEEEARAVAEKTLADTSYDNFIHPDRLLITTRELAISVAEPILFSVYGEDNIKDERPYAVYNIGNNWIMSGSLAKDHDGGTFLLVMDATNGRIVRIIHGK